ncbi:MAG: LysM peptidoglycan-binding domain-containing protein [Eubacterium sp.]|nr:LysM peptidoglycan-binding domain-containing protein [Eubacterium sp.]
MNTARRNRKRARIIQLRKRLFLSGTVIAVLIVMLFTIIGLKDVNATNNSDNPMYKYYTSYEIQPGDTLTSIAQKYTVNSNVSISEYIREVKKNNNLVSDRITSGNYIVISYYSDEYK